MIKPGILAFVVKSACGNNGKIVEVIRLLGLDASHEGKKWNKGRVSWLCKTAGTPLTSTSGREYVEMPIAEDCLKPIEPLNEDEDVTDETKSLSKEG